MIPYNLELGNLKKTYIDDVLRSYSNISQEEILSEEKKKNIETLIYDCLKKIDATEKINESKERKILGLSGGLGVAAGIAWSYYIFDPFALTNYLNFIMFPCLYGVLGMFIGHTIVDHINTKEKDKRMSKFIQDLEKIKRTYSDPKEYFQEIEKFLINLKEENKKYLTK
ncbi:MAG: hypothetical protein QW524_00815 [Candidatus Woesearchaeota archaeon]